MEIEVWRKEFIQSWSDFTARWGMTRTEGRIQGLLLCSERALGAAEMAKALGLARSNVSMGLRDLQRRGFVKSASEGRRLAYSPMRDAWRIFFQLADEERRMGIEPLIGSLAASAAKEEEPQARRTLEDLGELFQTLSTWYGEMRNLPVPVVRNFLKLGDRAVEEVLGP